MAWVRKSILSLLLFGGERLAKASHRLRHARLNSSYRDRQPYCDLRIGQSFQMAELENAAVVLRQRLDRFLERLPSGRFHGRRFRLIAGGRRNTEGALLHDLGYLRLKLFALVQPVVLPDL